MGGYYIITPLGVAGRYWWAALAAASLAAGAYALGAPPGDAGPAPAAAPAPEPDVVMPTKSSRPGCEEDDGCYVPSRVSVPAGGRVTWLNGDSAFHSVTSGSYGAPDGLFDSGHMDPGATFTVGFGEEGEFGYHCTLHPWMAGLVDVG